MANSLERGACVSILRFFSRGSCEKEPQRPFLFLLWPVALVFTGVPSSRVSADTKQHPKMIYTYYGTMEKKGEARATCGRR